MQDFGHQGDGFWLQGGNVSLTNNVVAGQRHAGYVFFPSDWIKRGWASPRFRLLIWRIQPGRKARRRWPTATCRCAFKGNKAFASGDAFESWFSLLNVSDSRESVVEDFSAWGLQRDRYIRSLHQSTDVQERQSQEQPEQSWRHRLCGNSVTRSLTYDHVNLQGWNVGIDAPVNGINEVIGGTFNNLKNIDISTSNWLNRVVNIHDGGPPIR